MNAVSLFAFEGLPECDKCKCVPQSCCLCLPNNASHVIYFFPRLTEMFFHPEILPFGYHGGACRNESGNLNYDILEPSIGRFQINREEEKCQRKEIAQGVRGGLCGRE